MPGRSYNSPDYRYGFNGKEKIDEIYGEGNAYDLGARMYSPRLGKMFIPDPLESEYPWQSTYAYFGNSPIWQVDFNGMGSTSTHTDKDGKVIAVYNDGDNKVYKHDDVSKWDGKSVLNKEGNGVSVMGKTKYWDEFARHDPKNNILETSKGSGNYADPQAQIMFTTAINNYVDAWHKYAKEQMDKVGIGHTKVGWLQANSARGKVLDIKDDLGHSKGYLLGDFYVTGESAGNYLFGLNLDYAKPLLYSGHKDDWWQLTMKQVGHYHNRSNKVNNPDVPPYYGEINSSGRWIENGFWGGKKSLK